MTNIKLLVFMSKLMGVHCEFQTCRVSSYKKMYGNLDNVQHHDEIRNNAEVVYEGATPLYYPPSLSIKVHVITMNCLAFYQIFLRH